MPTRFRGFEERFRKLGALGAWLCCVLLIGLGLSPAAVAQTTVTYIHTGALGSVVAENDANDNVIKRYDYEPYCAVVGEGGGQDRKFAVRLEPSLIWG
ncbi:hypothetical protein R1H25_02555 [Stenotrophomonas sp. C2852]|nr:hypothetical protein [Stenotrophomonas sp. C2852]